MDDKDDVAPGWDLWSVEIGNGRGYYDFKLAVNGQQRKESHKGEYLTDVINRRAVEDVHAARRPATLLPLGSAERPARREHERGQRRPVRRRVGAPAARPRSIRQTLRLPRLPGVLEGDVSDKPEIVSGQPPTQPEAPPGPPVPL